MDQFLESAISLVGLSLLMAPAALRLIFLAYKRYRGYSHSPEQLRKGLRLIGTSLLFSPLLTGLLIYRWSLCGPGCASGLALIPLLIPTWLFFVWSEFYVGTYASPMQPREKTKS